RISRPACAKFSSENDRENRQAFPAARRRAWQFQIRKDWLHHPGRHQHKTESSYPATGQRQQLATVLCFSFGSPLLNMALTRESQPHRLTDGARCVSPRLLATLP